MSNESTERDFIATFVVRDDRNPMNLPIGATFTEPIRGTDALDALDCHGGFSWAEYLHATEADAR